MKFAKSINFQLIIEAPSVHPSIAKTNFVQRNNIHTRVERRRSRNRGEVNSASVSRNVPRSINPKRYYAFHPFVVVVASRRVVQRTRTYERLFIFDFPRICLSTCCRLSLSLSPSVCVYELEWTVHTCACARMRGTRSSDYKKKTRRFCLRNISNERNFVVSIDRFTFKGEKI